MQLGPIDPSSIEIPQGQSSEQSDAQAQAQTGDPIETQDANPVAYERLLARLRNSESLPAILFSVGILLMVMILMRKLLRNTRANRRRTNRLPSPQRRIAEINERANASMDMSTSVMVETEDMARRLGAVLDNKAARLELLIEEADRKLAQLNKSLLGASIDSSIPSPTAAPGPAEPHARTIDPSLLDRARLEQDVEDRQSRVAGRIDPVPASEPSPTLRPTEQQTTQSKVLELADAGCTNIEIAHQLNEPIGQVELILNLRKQQG